MLKIFELFGFLNLKEKTTVLFLVGYIMDRKVGAGPEGFLL